MVLRIHTLNEIYLCPVFKPNKGRFWVEITDKMMFKIFLTVWFRIDPPKNNHPYMQRLILRFQANRMIARGKALDPLWMFKLNELLFIYDIIQKRMPFCLSKEAFKLMKIRAISFGPHWLNFKIVLIIFPTIWIWQLILYD